MKQPKSTEEANTTVTPKVITRNEAEQLSDYAQDLNDEVTHVVDYGDIKGDKKK
jgi:hypothetical protein|tara:strand:+ start:14763 stop:14924 length:162 start_codon:yes stop_codon:yes gene_type:complete